MEAIVYRHSRLECDLWPYVWDMALARCKKIPFFACTYTYSQWTFFFTKRKRLGGGRD